MKLISKYKNEWKSNEFLYYPADQKAT